MTRRVAFLVVALCALLPFEGIYAQAPIEVYVGGVPILISVPNGYVDSSKNADLFAIRKIFTPRHRRLLAFFVAAHDLQAAESGKEPDLRQTFDVQTSAADENKVFSEAGFTKVKEQVRAQFRDMTQSISSRTTRLEELLKQLDNQARLEVKGVEPIGVIEESPYSITVLFVTQSQIQITAGVGDDTNISAITVAAIKGKPIWFITRRTLKEKGDIDIVSLSARQWIASVQEVNP